MHYVSPISKKALAAAKFIIVTTLLLSILFLSQNIIAQDEFSLEQTQEGNGSEFGVMADFSDCINITTPGIYTLTADITNSAYKHCIKINTSDVVLNGNGFTIDGTDANPSFGIFIDNRTETIGNITINDVIITDWRYGIYINNTLNVTVKNSTSSSNSYGIFATNTRDTNIIDNNLSSNPIRGIEMFNVSGSNITNNNASYSSSASSGRGIYIYNSTNNSINYNNASSNNVDGIKITYSTYITLNNNFISGNGINGIVMDRSNYSSITNNIATANRPGITMLRASHNNMTNNTINNNYAAGLYLNGANMHNNITNNTIQENEVGDLSIQTANFIADYCLNIINNNLGSGGRPIKYFNSTTTVQHENLSELILCNADSSVIYNVSIDGSNSLKNNVLYVLLTNNSNISNIRSVNNYEGIKHYQSNNNTLQNSITQNNSIAGIGITSSDYNRFTNNTADYHTESEAIGIFLWASHYNNLTNNSANINNYDGIQLEFSDNNTLIGNTANNNSWNGILIYDGMNNTLIGNTANNNTQNGISIGHDFYTTEVIINTILVNNIANFNEISGINLYSVSNNTLINNSFKWNLYSGILLNNYDDEYVDSKLAINILTNNSAEYNGIGIYLNSSNNNMIIGNILNSNTNTGISIVNSTNNTFTENNAINNSVWDTSISGSLNNIFTNLTIGPLISFTGYNISLKNASLPAADPTGFQNISKWINITNTTTNAWIYLNISYTDAEISGLDESLLIIGRHNGSWETTTSTFASPSGVVTNQNYVYANITDIGNSSSIFAPLGTTAGDTTVPVVRLTSPANDTTSGTGLIAFNCSATDETALSNVTLFSTINGSWSSNFTYDISGTSNQTNLTVNGIAEGTYIWNCLVKDTSNNEAFNSTNYTINIDTTVPSEVTLLSPTEAYSSTDPSVNFSFLTLDNLDTNLTCNLTFDGVVTHTIGATNGTPASIIKTVSVGSHQWNVTCYDNAGNSNISITRNFTITQAATTPPTTGGGGGTVGGGNPLAPEPPGGLPDVTLPPKVQLAPEPPGNVQPFDDVLLPDDPAFGDIMSSVIRDLTPIQVDLDSLRIEKGIEVQFGGRGRLKLFFAKGKMKTRIEINDENLDLSIPKLSINLFAIFYPILLILVILTLTYIGVDYTYERFMPKLTELKTIAIKSIKLIVKNSGDNPTKTTLYKCMNVFTKFLSKQLKIIKPTYNSAFKAMPNDKRKKDFLKIYTEFKAKEGKSITKKELKTITKDMIKLIKKL